MSNVCFVTGCNRVIQAKNLCSTHYARLLRNGSTMESIPINRKGKRIDFLLSLERGIDDCIKWPFPSNRNGYGTLCYNGKQTTASRVCCILFNGNPPSDNHQAAHSCGNGSKGCVNPDHIRWATPRENTLEKNDHGTMMRGESHTNAKLTDEQVSMLRERSKTERVEKLAKEFGISRGYAFDLVSGKYRKPDCSSIRMEKL